MFVNELRKKRKSTNCSDLMTQIDDSGQAILSISARKCFYCKQRSYLAPERRERSATSVIFDRSLVS